MPPKVPIVYAYLYQQIKRRNHGDVVSTKQLKHTIQLYFIQDITKGGGGSKKGMPKIFMYHIINDLRENNLIKRVNHTTFKILKSNCEKQLRGFPF